MTADLQTQIFTTWLPLAIAIIFGLIGLLRGALREAILAAAVALAAFINSQWAAQWGAGFYGLYSGWPQQGEQFFISLIVLWAVALVLGFGLGSLLPRGSLPGWSRLLGGLLGLLNGAALAGWSLRYYITNTDGTLAPGVLLDTLTSRSFIIWATWFPLILALLGVVTVIVGPLRRMQGAVAQPASESDWTPTSPARPPLAGSGVPMAAVGAPGAGVPYAPPPQGVRDTGSTSQTRSIRDVDSPATNLLPVREASTPPSGYTPPVVGPAQTTRITGATANDPGTYSSTDSASALDSSWLLPREEGMARVAGSGDMRWAGPHTPEPEAPTQESRSASTASSEAPTVANEQVTAEDTSQPAEQDTVVQAASTAPAPVPATKTCPNCGSQVMSNALFCTNCGTRMP